jgi:hypothetical protein
MTKHHFTFRRVAVKGEKQTFAVFVTHPNGTVTQIGTAIHWWIRHLEMMGWEALAADGHRAVHKTRHQAAMALLWDGTGYPFPMARA